MLPPGLKLEAQRLAQERGVSLGDLVREALGSLLQVARERGPVRDALFADDEIWEGEVPADLSAHPDRYLYGDDA
jgi:hypothetical protein